MDLPRRSAKSYTCVLDAFHDHKDHPRSKYAFIALTRPSAEQIAWDVVRTIDDRLELGCYFQEAKLRTTFPNKATLQLFGADQKEWVDRLRGQKFRRVYIDEAAFYRVNMKRFIEEVLEPALMDEDGTLWLVGSPGDMVPSKITDQDIQSGRYYFYCAAHGFVPGWQRFKWTPIDNPHMREQYARKIAEKRALNPDIDKDPGFRREYLGEWVQDVHGLVYEVGDIVDEYEVNYAKDSFVLAVDFGHGKDLNKTSFTVGCYSDSHPNYVVLESWKREGMLIPDIAEEIKNYELKYPGIYILGDYASESIIEELRSRFNLPIYDAEKDDKHNWFRIYNSDVATGRVKIIGPACQDLIDEQRQLKKLVRYDGSWKEHPSQPNDCCDSNLYAFRHCYHGRYAPPEYKPEPGSPEAINKEMEDYIDKYAEEMAELYERNRRF